MLACQINGAGRDLESFVNKMHDAIRQVRRKVRPVIVRSILTQASRDVNARILLAS